VAPSFGIILVNRAGQPPRFTQLNKRQQVIVTETNPAYASPIVQGTRRRVLILHLGKEDIIMDCATYELKYCERCGALGTRRSATNDTYCQLCEQILTRSFSPEALSRRPRLRRGAKRPSLPLQLKAEAQPAWGGVL